MALPKTAAAKVLDDLRVFSIEDLRLLREIAYERGATVLEEHLDGMEAQVVSLGQEAIITISTTVKNHRRRRFAIAHELGHLEMHRGETSVSLCVAADINGWKVGGKNRVFNREREADLFAAALLLPERFFKPLCQSFTPSFDLIENLSNRFDTSLTATAKRYMDFCSEACVIVYAADGVIRGYTPSAEFKRLGIVIPVGESLDPYSLAASAFQSGEVPKAMEQVDASCWFCSGPFRRDALIQEHSRGMPGYNSVLTLLWIDEDIHPDDTDDDAYI